MIDVFAWATITDYVGAMDVNGDTGPGATLGGQHQLIQLLTPTGERVSSTDVEFNLSAEAEVEFLRSSYRDMALLRRFDIEATALQRHGEIGIWSQVLGQEGANIGAGRALQKQDFAFPTYRDHGLTWCKGVDPLDVIELFRGVNRGGWDARVHGVAYPTIVIGAHTLHATGYAMALQRDGDVGSGDPGS